MDRTPPSLRAVGSMSQRPKAEIFLKMFYVYLLKSNKDGSFYIGQTDNIKERLERHNSGFVISTKNKRPWNLLGTEGYSTRELARWKEYKLKRSANEKNKFIKKFTSSSFNG